MPPLFVPPYNKGVDGFAREVIDGGVDADDGEDEAVPMAAACCA